MSAAGHAAYETRMDDLMKLRAASAANNGNESDGDSDDSFASADYNASSSAATAAAAAAAQADDLSASRNSCILRSVATLALVGVLAVGIGLAVLYISAPHSTIQIPHTASFKFESTWPSTDPDMDALVYTGSMHKTETADGNWVVSGTVSYPVPEWNRTNTMTFLNNRVYITVRHNDGTLLYTGCMDDGGPFPHFDELRDAIDASAAVSPQDAKLFVGATSCPSGEDAWVLEMGGDLFTFCNLEGSGPYNLFHQGFTAQMYDVRTVDAVPSVTEPPLDKEGKPMDCPVIPLLAERVPGAHSGAPATTPAQAPAPAASAGRLRARRLAGGAKHSRRRLGKSIKCIFVHGAGFDSDSGTTTSWTSAWGQVHKSDGCDSVAFVHRDTTNRAWDDASLRNYFCNLAGNKDGDINNKFIFSHGSGSLIVAAALHSDSCRLKASSRWYTAGAMVTGSKSADALHSLCANYASYMDEMNARYHFCLSNPDGSKSLAPGYQSLRPSYSPLVSWANVASTIASQADGAMCGTSAWGLNDDISYALGVLADNAGLASQNDGFTEWDPCSAALRNAGRSFGTSYKNAYYTTNANHADLSCLFGDGLWNSRKPCKWYNEF